MDCIFDKRKPYGENNTSIGAKKTLISNKISSPFNNSKYQKSNTIIDFNLL